ncbi:3682_t:CDS:2, partial [Gigaspora margarita]
MSTIFDKEKEDNIVDLDEELDNQPQNTDNLVEKIKINLHKALNHYWNAPLNHLLITMLLEPCCKSIAKLNNWKLENIKEKFPVLSSLDANIWPCQPPQHPVSAYSQ